MGRQLEEVGRPGQEEAWEDREWKGEAGRDGGRGEGRQQVKMRKKGEKK